MGQSRRELLFAILGVVTASSGCSGLPGGDRRSDDRLTPAPVPEPTATGRSTPESENGRAIAIARDERGHWAGIESRPSAVDSPATRTPDGRLECGRSPDDVVESQVRTLRTSGTPTDTDIRAAWQFVAPSYRRRLGGLERFETAVRTTYRPLVEAEAVTYGPLSRTGETATRRVTAASGDTTTTYVWRLERQGGGTSEGCWLTTAIEPA